MSRRIARASAGFPVRSAVRRSVRSLDAKLSLNHVEQLARRLATGVMEIAAHPVREVNDLPGVVHDETGRRIRLDELLVQRAERGAGGRPEREGLRSSNRPARGVNRERVRTIQ